MAEATSPPIVASGLIFFLGGGARAPLALGRFSFFDLTIFRNPSMGGGLFFFGGGGRAPFDPGLIPFFEPKLFRYPF